jgi:hypothetical protein
MWYEDDLWWARESIEWLRGDRRIDSPAGPKAAENCHRDADKQLKAPEKLDRRPYMLMNLGQRDEPLLLLVGFLSILIGYHCDQLFKIPSVLLGGLKTESDPNFSTYQRQTFAILATTFFATYIYSLGRLLDRVNNNDLYPVSLYYYTIRVAIAVVVAAVIRHSAEVFGLNSNPVLLLVAFGIGFAPDLFILAIIRRAFQALKIWGARGEPDAKSRPTSLPLLTIDDCPETRSIASMSWVSIARRCWLDKILFFCCPACLSISTLSLIGSVRRTCTYS